MPDPCFPGSIAPTQLSYFTSGISALLAIIITIGNALIICTVAKDPLKKLRNPFAFFLVNAAVSDFAVGVVAMPVSAVFHYKEAHRKINRTFIYILHLTYFISATASLVSMAAMAIDRYLKLVSFTANRNGLTLRRSIFISSLIWILAFGFSGFYFLTGYVTLVLIYVNTSLISSFGITLVTYVKVIRQMHETRKSMRAGTNLTPKTKKSDRAILRENKVTKVFMAMLLAFLCVYFPTTVFSYTLQFCMSCSCDVRHVLRDLAFLLVSAASATNPVICLWKMPTIRKSIYAILKCRKKNRLANTTLTNSTLVENRNTGGAYVIDKSSPVVLIRYQVML